MGGSPMNRPVPASPVRPIEGAAPESSSLRIASEVPEPQCDTFRESTSRIAGTEEILLAFAQAVERRDRHTARHCERLALICVALGTALKLDQQSLVTLYRGAFLHDVGKVGVPDDILFSPNRLTAEQWTLMRRHPVHGEQICSHVDALKPVLPIIRHHHERFDGSGYPDGLRGAEIPLLARVLQLADIYDALTSVRPYKPAYSAGHALHIIEKETVQGLRDPELVHLFFRLHEDVISRIDRWNAVPDERFEEIRHTLATLDAALKGEVHPDGLGDPFANDRTFARQPRFAPLNGSAEGATGTLHTG